MKNVPCDKINPLARTRIARFTVPCILICTTALLLAYLNKKELLSPTIHSLSSTGEHCETFLHWDMGMVSLETLTIKPNDTFGKLLSSRGVIYAKIDDLINKATSIFPLKSIRAGKELTLVRDNMDSTIHAIIYEPDPYKQIIYHLEDSIFVESIDREISTEIQTASGTINNSLWVSMEEQGLPFELITAMEDALGWSVDFYHIQKGDAYKLVYERKLVDGKPLGIGKLLAAEYTSDKTTYHAIRFKNNLHDGFFDLEGRPMKKAFLKSPVEYSRISSRFSNNRFHPILKRNKGHFGTDYAASCGSPIRAVADGRVTKASFNKGNGNFVKIHHDKVYDTQYLHMSRFAPGIKPGAMVKQGQTIGYVGQTGLATGCHVCFRFWKNGKQVDHLKEKMPPPQAMSPEQLEEYKGLRDQMKLILQSIKEGENQCIDLHDLHPQS